MIARVGLVACAAVAVVVLAGQLSIARDIDHAIPRSRADLPRVQRILEDAARRTSDTTPLLREAQALLFADRPREAVAPARRATEEEPENAQAWLLLSQAAASSDPGLAARARRRLRELVPPIQSSR